MNFSKALVFGNVCCVSNFYPSKSSTFHFCAEPENWCQNQMFDSGKRAFHTFIKNTSWQIQANGTGHICVSMVDSAETTLVIYRKHCKNWMYL